METRTAWANYLKKLRTGNEPVLFNALSNIPVVFTHDTIKLTAPNQTTYDILNKYKDNFRDIKFPVIIETRPHSTHTQDIKIILKNIFGDKLEII